MAANIEIKARVADFAKQRERIEKLGGTPVALIQQEDTFFNARQGRLKLRVLAPDKGELIFYERSDSAGPKRSDYLLAPTSDPQALKSLLASAYGVRGVVRKQRLLYLVGNARIHLDQVEGLGAFTELEIVLTPEQRDSEGQALAADLMIKLEIQEKDLIGEAYIDLLEKRAASSNLFS